MAKRLLTRIELEAISNKEIINLIHICNQEVKNKSKVYSTGDVKVLGDYIMSDSKDREESASSIIFQLRYLLWFKMEFENAPESSLYRRLERYTDKYNDKMELLHDMLSNFKKGK